MWKIDLCMGAKNTAKLSMKIAIKNDQRIGTSYIDKHHAKYVQNFTQRMIDLDQEIIDCFQRLQ